MNSAQVGQVGLAGAILLAIVPSAPPPPSLTEAHKFKNTLLGPLQIPGAIV